jgi:uncharacterized coiled-coil DUF342 family protein
MWSIDMTSAHDAAELLNTVRRERDEINLQLHLLKAEARDEWAQLEKKYAQFQNKSKTVGAVASGAAGDVGAAARILGEELRAAYLRLRDALKTG